MKYYEDRITYLNGLWWGVSRGFLTSLLPVLGQVVLIAMISDALKHKQKMSAYTFSIALIVSILLYTIIFFNT